MYIVFENEVEADESVVVSSVEDDGYLPVVRLTNGREYYLAHDFDQASQAAKQFWFDLIARHPARLNDLIGGSVLRNWSLGREDGPGSEKINTSLEQWIENTVAKHPDIAFGHYAGSEFPVKVSDDLASLLDYEEHADTTTVVYPVPEGVEKGTIPPRQARLI